MNENGTESSALQSLDGPSSDAPGHRSPLIRLFMRLKRRSPQPLRPARPADAPGLARARAALEAARLEMPGLLADPPMDPIHTADEPPPTLAPSSRAVNPSDELGRLGAVEDLIGRLEEERRQLGSEVAALRLIVEELREALQRLDEPAAGVEPVEMRLPSGSEHQTAAAEPSRPALPPEDGYLLPAGSVGIQVHLESVEGAEMLADIQIALANLPELDGVRIAGLAGQEATLRCYLRRPQTEASLLEALQRALPSAKPLAGPAPGRLLLRMRPV